MSGPPLQSSNKSAADESRPIAEKAESGTGSRPIGARFPAPAQASSAGSQAGSWRLRNWRLRTRLVVLLVIPLVLAGVLGGLRIASSVSDIQDLSVAQREVALREAVATVTQSVQTERHLAAAVLAAGDQQRAAFDEQIQEVDADVAAMLDLEANPEALAGTTGDAYQNVLVRLEGLPDIRDGVLAADPSANPDILRYTEVLTTLLNFSRVALAATAAESAPVTAGIGYLAEAKEQLSVEHALLLAASLRNEVTPVVQTQLRRSDAAFDSAIASFSESVPARQRQIYVTTVREDTLADRQRLLLIARGEGQTVPLDSIATEWDETASALGGMLFTVETSLTDDLLAATGAAKDAAVTNTIRDASIIALLLLFTLILLVLVARSVLRPLRTLRTGALDVATRRLPAVVERLQRPGGWNEEVRPEPMPMHTRDDIGEVARAFDAVHSQAVRLASEQAMMRGNVNDMFINLSRRSQSLVERQLRIIDSLESGERDPEALGELFRLDHLATRMRRNNENLLVLSGAETRQRVGAPRPVLDILRGAISEIEDYQRITIESVPDTTVRAVAVNDLVHLIAELLDNATNSSPKDAQVVLASSVQADGGLRVEIRDTGVGMSATQRNAINDRLALPPMVDVSVARHMGLFVVGRLAARHSISVRMQGTGPEGGLTAVVSIPSALISAEVERPGQPGRAADPEGADLPVAAAGTGSMFDSAPTGAMARAGAAPTFDPAGNGGLVPAGIGSGPNGTGNGLPFDAAATQALDLFPAAAPARSGRTSNLFAATVPSGQQTTDFFAALPLADSSSQGEGEGTPIFQEMRSAWFRQGSSIPAAANNGGSDRSVEASDSDDSAAAAEVGGTPDFGSSADEGWQAAEQLRTPVDAGTTQAGLPRRRPRAHLVPGGTARPAAETSTSGSGRMNNVTVLRDAERVRGSLSSYQRGTHRGRHSSPMEDSERSIGDPTRNGVGRHGELPNSQERQ